MVEILIDAFNEALESFAKKRADNVFFVDVRNTVGDRWDDELHPTSAGYAAVAAKFHAAIEEHVPRPATAMRATRSAQRSGVGESRSPDPDVGAAVEPRRARVVGVGSRSFTPPEAVAKAVEGFQIVTFLDHGEPQARARALSSAAGVRVENVTGRDAAASLRDVAHGNLEGAYLDTLGLAVLRVDPDQSASVVAVADRDRGVVVEEDRWARTAVDWGDYQAGFVKAAETLRDAYTEARAGLPDDTIAPSRRVHAEGGYEDGAGSTWGLHACGIPNTNLTGAGIRVAVLDTGLDFDHPDFQNRTIAFQRNFVEPGRANDLNGHGTHCVGTVCGPTHSGAGLRYGVAPEVEIMVGKVLNDGGAGRVSDILDGLGWAVAQQADVVSLSLTISGPPMVALRRAVEVCLDQGIAVICAAGNGSRRPLFERPMPQPASFEGALAVGAVDQDLRVSRFSNIAPGGKNRFVSAPGVGVFSSYATQKAAYEFLDGTSMACPHVAGIAALRLQRDGGRRGAALMDDIASAGNTTPLVDPPQAVGTGMARI